MHNIHFPKESNKIFKIKYSNQINEQIDQQISELEYINSNFASNRLYLNENKHLFKHGDIVYDEFHIYIITEWTFANEKLKGAWSLSGFKGLFSNKYFKMFFPCCFLKNENRKMRIMFDYITLSDFFRRMSNFKKVDDICTCTLIADDEFINSVGSTLRLPDELTGIIFDYIPETYRFVEETSLFSLNLLRKRQDLQNYMIKINNKNHCDKKIDMHLHYFGCASDGVLYVGKYDFATNKLGTIQFIDHVLE